MAPQPQTLNPIDPKPTTLNFEDVWEGSSLPSLESHVEPFDMSTIAGVLKVKSGDTGVFEITGPFLGVSILFNKDYSIFWVHIGVPRSIQASVWELLRRCSGPSA